MVRRFGNLPEAVLRLRRYKLTLWGGDMFRLWRSLLIASVAFTASAVVSGCAGDATLVSQPINGQRLVAKTDSQTLISTKTNIVRLQVTQPKSVEDNRAEILVNVKNLSGMGFTLSTNSITAEAIYFRDEEFIKDPLKNLADIEHLVQTKSLKVLDPSELIAEEEERYIAASVVSVWTSLARDILATTGKTYAGYDYGAMNREDARRFARLQTEGETKYMRDVHKRKMQELSMLMKGGSVSPGHSYGGVVLIETPNATRDPIPLRIHVRAGRETHMFAYLLKR